ncbi:MAG: 4-hydroxy-tetrahydrodipicolinate reductase [Cyclobacteriaceae bacterium]|nr:4-hydroxy-tetrahydrodipicolinate reductase [Cyclobacteriaceae bacterium]
MNIALIGYGKMGKAIEKIALKRGHEIVARVELGSDSLDEIKEAQVAIEFTQPESAFNNIKKCIDLGFPVLSGTTGWLDKKEQIEEYCRNRKGTFFYASNYSIGVNLFFKINEIVAEIMNNNPQYNSSMEEIHHIHKLDSPSGTAITLAEGVLKHLKSKSQWQEGESNNPNVLPIYSKREGEVPGTHSVSYESEMDNITLTHTAHTRDSFALGAVMVAEWLHDKKGVLSMSNYMGL